MSSKRYFKVNKIRWSSSNIQYAVLFLEDRLLFAKVAGQFADASLGGAVVGGVLGGAVGGVIGGFATRNLEKKVRKSHFEEKEKAIEKMLLAPPSEILSLDKANFEIRYEDISMVGLRRSSMGINGPRAGVLRIEEVVGDKKKNVHKFDLSPAEDPVEPAKLLKSVLKSKANIINKEQNAIRSILTYLPALLLFSLAILLADSSISLIFMLFGITVFTYTFYRQRKLKKQFNKAILELSELGSSDAETSNAHI